MEYLGRPIDGGRARPVSNFTADRIFWFAWSPDGSQLAVSRGADHSDVITISRTK